MDLLEASKARRKHHGFWTGWGGILTTVTMGGFVVALLVGWVLLWVEHLPSRASVTLLTLGCIAFTLLLALLATLQNRLHAHFRLRQAEALFLAGISHNLRTPISAIRVAAQALLQSEADPLESERLLSAIVRETRRLGLRVDNVLESGRIEVERLAFENTRVDLNRMLESIADELRGVLDYRGGEIELDANAPVSVSGDTRAIRLLLDNLVDNALKYTEDVPHLELRLARESEFARIHVRDHGAGFRNEEVAKFFKPWHHGEAQPSGIGLGLPLARAIARGHGGDLHLQSEGPGRGATAEVWLPLCNET